MSVALRGKKWHYRFSHLKKTYSGVCVGCENQKDAEVYESKIKKEVESLRHHKTVASLVEDYRRELSGGVEILLINAFDVALSKPSRNNNRDTPSIRNRKSSWLDFCKFLSVKHSSIRTVDQVKKHMCEEYISYIIKNGRFDKICAYTRGANRGLRQLTSKSTIIYSHDYKLKPRTIKDYASAIKWVFTTLAEDTGMHRNPMDGIVLPSPDDPERDIFTEEELVRIREGIKYDDICRPLFTVAAMTGLTEGDICTLKWSQLNFRDRVIVRRRNKTGAYLEIPMGESLMSFIESYPRLNEYVFPELQELYDKGAISDKVKEFLDRLGIENTKKEEGYRAVSTKDLHSMRHVFCFYAGQAGIPITTVQSIVGHMTEEMTRHYSRHDNLKSKHRAIEKLPDFLLMTDSPDSIESSLRKDLADLAYSLPIDKVKEILEKYQ